MGRAAGDRDKYNQDEKVFHDGLQVISNKTL